MDLDSKIKSLIEEIKQACSEWGVTFVIENNEDEKVQFDSTTKCSGFYQHENKLLKVAMKSNKEEFIGLLAHEFCHGRQFNTMADHPVVKAYNSDPSPVIFDLYLAGKATKSKAKEVLPKIIAVELQCEKMTAELLEKHDIQLTNYIRMANLYLLSHRLMLKKKKFIETLNVNGIEQIPDRFLSDYKTKQWDHIVEGCF